MSRDVIWMLSAAFACFVVAAVLCAWLLGDKLKRRARERRVEERQRRLRASAPTTVYSRAEWRDLWQRIDSETVLLHQVRQEDPTAFPKPKRRAYSGGRWPR